MTKDGCAPSLHEVRGAVDVCPGADLWARLEATFDFLVRRIDALSPRDDSDTAREGLRRVRALTTEALLALQAVADGTARACLHGARIEDVLRRLTTRLQHVTDACTEFRAIGSVEAVSPETAGTLAQVAGEMVGGLERHGRASIVVLSLEVTDGTAVLEIKDDGVDLRQRQLSEWGPTPGPSMSALAQLVRSAGGRFVVYTGPPHGLCLQAVIPLVDDEEAQS